MVGSVRIDFCHRYLESSTGESRGTTPLRMALGTQGPSIRGYSFHWCTSVHICVQLTALYISTVMFSSVQVQFTNIIRLRPRKASRCSVNSFVRCAIFPISSVCMLRHCIVAQAETRIPCCSLTTPSVYRTFTSWYSNLIIKMATVKPILRRSHQKSKEGCQTCKRRHIKCDEFRPTWLVAFT